MQEKNKLVEEALLQMKNVEDVIAENAKGILQSTMKEEISQLVKESLLEQDDEDLDDTESDVEPTDDESDSEDMEMGDVEMDDMEMGDMEMTDFETDDMEMGDMGTDEMGGFEDLTDLSDDEFFEIFMKMPPDSEIHVIPSENKKEIHFEDGETDKEYLIKLKESEEKDMNDTEEIIRQIFNKDSDVENSDLEETIYEIQFDEEDMDEEEMYEYSHDMEEEEMYEYSDDMDEEEEMDEEDMDEEIYESKKSFKPKGMVGKVKKVEFRSNTKGGFDEDKKEGPKREGKTGSAKTAVKYEGENLEKAGKNKIVKKVETKEAARTLGNGKKWGREGLDKPRSAPRHLQKESMENEVKMLREKNEEYRKALNVFREKLNEVAIFNSNLAYAVRLFTEHSTTKKEKLNILRRFDDVESLKESKNLYRTLREDLSKSNSNSINESIETKLNKTVTTGSATTLIESKTYENPQFLRMKDLMTKIG